MKSVSGGGEGGRIKRVKGRKGKNLCYGTDRQIDRHTDRQIDRQTDKQTHRQTDTQTDR